MLTCAEDAHFGRRRVARPGYHAVAVDAFLFEETAQEAGVIVVANKASQVDVAVQVGQVGGDVGSAAEYGFDVFYAVYRNRCFRRNPFYLAEDIAVYHNVANDSDAQLGQYVVQEVVNISVRHLITCFIYFFLYRVP